MGQLDWGFVSSLLELTPEKAMSVSVDGSFLVDEGARQAYDFVRSHITQTGKVPSRALMQTKFPTLGDENEARDSLAIEWVSEELRKRKVYSVVHRGLMDATAELKGGSPAAVLSVVDEMVQNVHAVSQHVTVHDLQRIGAQLQGLYDEIKAGRMGIEFPWRSLNLMTRGMWPETVTFFAARPGTGKTFLAIIVARQAHLDGHKVLIISPEMNALEVGERFFSIEAGVPYSDVISGRLSQIRDVDGLSAEERYEKALTARIGPQGGPYIVDDEDRLTEGALEATIAAIQPDLVVVDAAYLLRIGKGSRYERIITVVEWLRHASKQFHVPVLATSQLTKEAEKKGAIGQITVALTDTINWDAHNLFALKQTQEMREDGKLSIHPVKVRRLAKAFGRSEITVNWDMDRMDFEEVEDGGEHKDAGYKANEFGAADDMPF